MTDAERLDWLERMGNRPDGLLLHSETNPTNRLGIALRCTGRSIREAIDQAADGGSSGTSGTAK